MSKNKHLTDQERLLIKRLLSEKTSLKKIAQKLGKHTSTDEGEILSFCLTAGNVDDRDFDKGITLVTKIRKNMKNVLMEFSKKLLLRKSAVIEFVNDFSFPWKMNRYF